MRRIKAKSEHYIPVEELMVAYLGLVDIAVDLSFNLTGLTAAVLCSLVVTPAGDLLLVWSNGWCSASNLV